MSFSITGLQSLKKRVADMRERISNPKPGLTRAALVVLKAARQRIKAGGPNWKPNLTGTPLLFKTGRLINSLTLGAPGNQTDYSGDSIMVGTNVPYARYLQEGTRSYDRGSPLAKKQGPRRFKHGGMPPRPFLYIDDPVAERVRSVFRNYIMKGLTNSGES